MKKLFFTYILLNVWVSFAGIEDSTLVKIDTTLKSQVFEDYKIMLEVIDKAIHDSYVEYYGADKTDSIIKAYNYADKDIPVFSDSIYKLRIQEMDALTPFQLGWNEDVIKAVKYFTQKRRSFTAIALGRSKLYFPIYEEYLDKYDLPLELKYLSIIESGLRPTVKSRVGATGLWQFMYRTGKAFGLTEDSYIDERMDPYKATDAACRYLKQLHGMYDDWSLALAAYNAGPGNVNKAIRRSGGKTTYWEIRPFLPRETQGYVPGFIAMAYMMTYHAEHNIRAIEARVYDYEVDTVCLKAAIRFKTLDTLLGVDMDDLIYLNPQYKKQYVPFTNSESWCIVLPKKHIPQFIEMEDSIYQFDSLVIKQYIETSPIVTENSTEVSGDGYYHTVRSGENLGVIGERYGVSVRNLMDWNNLSSTNINIGKKLLIRGKKPSTSTTTKTTSPTESKSVTTTDFKTPANTPASYSLKSGESLWFVSNKFGIPLDVLEKLNPNLDPKRMQPGDVIKLK